MQENKQEKSLIKQNILLYLSKKDVTPYEFYKKSGVTRGILQQNNGISEDNIARFLAYAPDVNVEWLITGNGDMLRTMQENKQEKSPYNDSLTYCTPKLADDPNVGKPYYDVDFIGGFTEIFNSQVSVPATNIVIRGFEKADLWCNVTGHSMEPKSTMATSLPFANVRWMMSSMAKYTLLCLTRYEPSRYCASLVILTSSVSSQSTCKISMNKNTPNQGY